jgi:hypothetical protein
MLVEMKINRSLQMAYTAREKKQCGVCRCNILHGELYTRHQTPDPRRISVETLKPLMHPYNACSVCAPFHIKENRTGELNVRDYMSRVALQSPIQHLDEIETEHMLPVVRSSTPRSLRRVQLHG